MTTARQVIARYRVAAAIPILFFGLAAPVLVAVGPLLHAGGIDAFVQSQPILATFVLVVVLLLLYPAYWCFVALWRIAFHDSAAIFLEGATLVTPAGEIKRSDIREIRRTSSDQQPHSIIEIVTFSGKTKRFSSYLLSPSSEVVVDAIRTILGEREN